jgi:hypothetical protein
MASIAKAGSMAIVAGILLQACGLPFNDALTGGQDALYRFSVTPLSGSGASGFPGMRDIAASDSAIYALRLDAGSNSAKILCMDAQGNPAATLDTKAAFPDFLFYRQALRWWGADRYSCAFSCYGGKLYLMGLSRDSILVYDVAAGTWEPKTLSAQLPDADWACLRRDPAGGWLATGGGRLYMLNEDFLVTNGEGLEADRSIIGANASGSGPSAYYGLRISDYDEAGLVLVNADATEGSVLEIDAFTGEDDATTPAACLFDGASGLVATRDGRLHSMRLEYRRF